MMAGFPDGTPLRGAMLWVYRHVFVLRFTRTTNKAAPLVAVGLAGLLGLTAQQLVAVTRRLGRVRLRRPATAGVAIALLAMMALAALPLIRGQAIDTQLEFKRIPTAWRQAGQGLDRTLPAQHPGAGSSRADLRLLQVGRDARRDPASPDQRVRSRCAMRRRIPTCTPSTC